MSDPNKGRIAIQFGSAASKPKASPQSSLGKRPRSTATKHFGGDSDSDSDNDERRFRGKHEAITGFGKDGAAETERSKRAAEAKAQKTEYVIARVPNRDWKADVKAQQKNGAANGSSSSNTTAEREPADQDKELKWGLSVKDKKTEPAPDAEDDDSATDTKQHESEAPPPAHRTADDEAMDALLGKTPKEERTIPAQATEDDAYKRDVEAAGAASTLEDYEAMPVEEFGAALLRGMGWDGQSRGPKVKEVRRRQNRLGLGAKELDGKEDLGGWDQKGKRPGQRARPPRLADYRREEEKKKEGRRSGREDSYKRERERERERDDGRHGHRDDRDRDRHDDRHRDGRDRHSDHDRDRRR